MITVERQIHNQCEFMQAIKSSYSVFFYKGIDIVNLKALVVMLCESLEIELRKGDFTAIAMTVLNDIIETDWKESNARSFTYRGMVGTRPISIHVKKDRVYNAINEEWNTTYIF